MEKVHEIRMSNGKRMFSYNRSTVSEKELNKLKEELPRYNYTRSVSAANPNEITYFGAPRGPCDKCNLCYLLICVFIVITFVCVWYWSTLVQLFYGSGELEYWLEDNPQIVS